MTQHHTIRMKSEYNFNETYVSKYNFSNLITRDPFNPDW